MFNKICWGLAVTLSAVLLFLGLETAMRLTTPSSTLLRSPPLVKCERSRTQARELVDILVPRYASAEEKERSTILFMQCR